MKKFLIVLMLVATSLTASAQDVIVKKDGSTILSKVIEVGTSDVKYKKFSNQKGPTYTVAKADIQAINYENGEQESFAEAVNVQPNPQPIQQTQYTGNNPYVAQPVEEMPTITMKAGTQIPLQLVNYTKAASVNIGQKISFRVSRDINIDGVTVIPYGTTVLGTVYEAKKSSWWGTKGRLGIRIDGIDLANGNILPLTNGDVYVTGKNRTTLSVLLFLFVTMPACAICGSKAEIPAGYEIVVNTATPIMFDYDGNVVPMSPQRSSYPAQQNRQGQYRR